MYEYFDGHKHIHSYTGYEEWPVDAMWIHKWKDEDVDAEPPCHEGMQMGVWLNGTFWPFFWGAKRNKSVCDLGVFHF